jgi:hypothetical protein
MTTEKKQKSSKIESPLFSRILLVLLVLAMVVFTVWVSGPVPPKQGTEPTATLLPKLETVKPSQASPDDWIMHDQATTDGVVLGTVAIFLIIMVGTLVGVWQARDKTTKKDK